MKIYRNLAQKTDEWQQVRLGKITGSDAAGLTSGKTSETVAKRKASEIITGAPDPYADTAATVHGREMEDYVVGKLRKDFELVGFVEKDTFLGYSPDGLGDDFLVEIKCPYYAKNFLSNVMDIPANYMRQMQYGMWICEKPQCLFVNYHENFTPSIVTQTVFFDSEAFSKTEALIKSTVLLIKRYLREWKRYEDTA